MSLSQNKKIICETGHRADLIVPKFLEATSYLNKIKENQYPFVFCYSHVEYGNSKEQIELFTGSLKKIWPGIPVVESTYWTPKETISAVRMVYYMAVRHNCRGNIIFLDTDIIAGKRFNIDIFNDIFDVGLTSTMKSWPLMRYNAGVIISKDTQGSMLFFDKYAESATNTPEDFVPNWIDQLGLTHVTDKYRDSIIVKEFSKMYNYVPNEEHPEDDIDAYFIHCKGARKYLMQYYFDRII